MNIKKLCLAGVAAFVFDAIVACLTCGGLFAWVYKLEPLNIWRYTEGIPSISFYAGSFICCLIFAFVYSLLSSALSGNRALKGLIFGLCVWAVGLLPGMLATYEFMTVATEVVIYWTVLGLIQTPLKGIIVALILDAKQETNEKA